MFAAEGRPRIAFVCPGQGAQWVGMAREAVAHEPVFREALEACDAAARPSRLVAWSNSCSAPETPDYRLDQIDVIQPVLVALAIAYARLWRARASSRMPSSATAWARSPPRTSRVCSTLDQAMRIICRRSAADASHQRPRRNGARRSFDRQGAGAAGGRRSQLAVAVNNSPRSSVISGDPAAVQQLLANWSATAFSAASSRSTSRRTARRWTRLRASLSANSTGLTPAQRRSRSTPRAGRRGEGTELRRTGAQSAPTRALRACVRPVLPTPFTVFIELGPHPCSPLRSSRPHRPSAQ